MWVLAGDCGGVAEELAEELAACNQTVLLTGEAQVGGKSGEEGSGVVKVPVEMERRESWHSLLQGLPQDMPLKGIVHLVALDGHGVQATTAEFCARCEAGRGSAHWR